MKVNGYEIKSEANLYGANLYGANLYGADLYEANLSGANLSEANLYGANLYGADLYGANLSEANLIRANLYGANLSKANLSVANLSKANLSRANLSGANLSRANLSETLGVKYAFCSWSGFGECGRLISAVMIADEIIFFCGCFRGNVGALSGYINAGEDKYAASRRLAMSWLTDRINERAAFKESA